MQKRIVYTEDSVLKIIIPSPDARLKILVSAARYEDYEATYDTFEIPATETEPATTKQVMTAPAGTRKVADAVYRDETDDEFYTRIALKDVPTESPYKIVDVADVPSDRTFRDAWTVDETLLTDGIGADYGAGSINLITVEA
jgi:hypothetical protein